MSELRTKCARPGPGWLLAILWISASAMAAEVKVQVFDRDGEPVPDVAVFTDIAADDAGPRPNAVMDQVDRRFVPHLLVIAKGTKVEFPNSDVVAHHVYSFSRPNDFILPLYKGDPHPPVSFDYPGVVALGCNIHDSMLAYILVVDSRVFAKTDRNGTAVLDVGDTTGMTISIWSPRVRSKRTLLAQTINVVGETTVVFRLEDELLPPHDGGEGGLIWSDY